MSQSRTERRAGEQSNEVVNDQGRLRQNIDSLNRVSGQQDRVQQYARDLSTSESKLAALRDRRRDLEQKKIQLELEEQELKNQLLKRQIELLDKSQEYRCCPVGAAPTP